jgi:DNA repair protein RadA/Sms
VIGWDSNRLAMVIAVLEARCGIALGGRDVYLNVAGGLRITEPAADLAVAAALISALDNTPFPPDSVVFGEMALSGEIRPVAQTELRLKEASKLGFETAYAATRKKVASPNGLSLQSVQHVRDLLQDGSKKAKRIA